MEKTDSNIIRAKNALDKVISKSRVHFYKPIQIAEILYRDRVVGDINLLDLETYRNRSKKWRDAVCLRFVGRSSNSSQRYQDDLFNDNATPPEILNLLGMVNRDGYGMVEAYIYNCFKSKLSQMSIGLDYCENHNKNDFVVKDFVNIFWNDRGLKRSIDKIYEIIVYALFEALVECLNIQVTISSDRAKNEILKEFDDFAEKVIGISSKQPDRCLRARINRVGVTNAADRGLDMWANFGMAIQIKHLSLTEELAENIVSSISSDRIVIVCKDSEESLIVSLLNQIGWKSKIQSIITENDLIEWYEKALRGSYSNDLGDKILEIIREQIRLEFPSSDLSDFEDFFKERKYNQIDL